MKHSPDWLRDALTRRVVAALTEPSPLRRLRWLMTPHPELDGESPIAVIREGRVPPMLLPLARAFGEQGGG